MKKFFVFIIMSMALLSAKANQLTSSIKNLAEGETLKATAVVSAQSTRGLILSDNSGSVGALL